MASRCSNNNWLTLYYKNVKRKKVIDENKKDKTLSVCVYIRILYYIQYTGTWSEFYFGWSTITKYKNNRYFYRYYY